jgi:ribosomal-protein-alanine N-acetyltransferase
MGLLTNTIETKRLILRELNPEYYNDIFSHFTDPELMHFFGFETERELLAEKKKHDAGKTTYNRSFLFFYIIEKSTGENIGWCGYHTFYLDHRRAELGYELTNEEHRGKGYMGEAIPPILKYGFEVMNLNRVEAFVGPKNIPSLKLVKKQGFIEEGTMRSHYFKNGVFEDSVIFSLLQSEYKLHG